MSRPRVRRDCQCPRARHVHGTRQAYLRDNCRCGDCTHASSVYEYRREKVRHLQRSGIAAPTWTTPIGIRRRLQALAVLGWTTREIGARLSVTGEAVEMLRRWDGKSLTSTADRVAAVYDALSMTVPEPWNRYRSRIRNGALRRSWAPPLAWDDIDDPDEEPKHRLRGGHAATERATDRAAEVAHLSTFMSAAEIAERIGVTQRTVVRDRAKRRAA